MIYVACGLINSNILIEIDEDSDITKTPLEMILDICIFYITLTSSKFVDNVYDKDINKDTIIEEQKIIYEFLKKILYFNNEVNSKELKNKYTIFYINDYLRLLNSNYPLDGKKRPKNEPFYSEFAKEFNIYQNNDKLLLNEKKYNFNFSTFFILKCNGYKKILFESIIKVLNRNPQAKNFLKFDDILELTIDITKKNYNEHELLFSKDKSFFFTSKKANCSYNYYSEIKRKIENCLKKNNYSEIDSYILHNIFNKDFDRLYTLIYSGCCINKKRQEYKLPETDKKIYSHALSSINLIKDIQEEIKQGSDMKRTLSDKKTSKKLSIKSETLSPQIGNSGNSASEKESLLTQDEYDFELQIEETPSFDNNKIDDNIINNDFNSHFFFTCTQ